jgi:hypothetical protein
MAIWAPTAASAAISATRAMVDAFKDMTSCRVMCGLIRSMASKLRSVDVFALLDGSFRCLFRKALAFPIHKSSSG